MRVARKITVQCKLSTNDTYESVAVIYSDSQALAWLDGISNSDAHIISFKLEDHVAGFGEGRRAPVGDEGLSALWNDGGYSGINEAMIKWDINTLMKLTGDKDVSKLI
jgi:hypothetical protein